MPVLTHLKRYFPHCNFSWLYEDGVIKRCYLKSERVRHLDYERMEFSRQYLSSDYWVNYCRAIPSHQCQSLFEEVFFNIVVSPGKWCYKEMLCKKRESATPRLSIGRQYRSSDYWVNYYRAIPGLLRPQPKCLMGAGSTRSSSLHTPEC